jgi:hypothetical protein
MEKVHAFGGLRRVGIVAMDGECKVNVGYFRVPKHEVNAKIR